MSNYSAGTSDAPQDPGNAFKWLVRLCGIGVIAGVFLPFFNGESILDIIQYIGDQGFESGINRYASGLKVMGGISTAFITAGYILFPLMGLSMLFRGKYAGGPLTVLILFNLIGWVLVHFFHPEMLTFTGRNNRIDVF